MSGKCVYVDTSAAVKIVSEESDSLALRSWLARHRVRIASELLRVELIRSIRRADIPALMEPAQQLIRGIHLIRIDEDILGRASFLDPVGVRSLDAIHIASALANISDLNAFVTYDVRMYTAALALGLPGVMPQ